MSQNFTFKNTFGDLPTNTADNEARNKELSFIYERNCLANLIEAEEHFYIPEPEDPGLVEQDPNEEPESQGARTIQSSDVQQAPDTAALALSEWNAGSDNGGIRQLITLSDYTLNGMEINQQTSASASTTTRAKPKPKPKNEKKAVPRRKYTMYQRVEFIKCLIDTAGKSAAACGRAQGINERTAQDWAKKYAEDPEK
ncbi:hypothetical protein BJV82DRAFT_583580 [Fennellomyces sp. T-0311]|nr:hypothetical protein BJV82DRAFT_583580 [Fennellomyces sp. T-0311]